MTELEHQEESGWRAAISTEELPEGKPVKVTVDGEDVLMYLMGERILAVSDRCTHLGTPLHRGLVKPGSTPSVTCPAHGSMFRLTDGRVLRGPAVRPVQPYEARVNGEMVEVRPLAPS